MKFVWERSYTGSQLRSGSAIGALGTGLMVAWEFASYTAGFPRPLDWTVNEALLGSVPAAFALHVGFGVVAGVVYEILRPAVWSRWAAAFAFSAILQLLLLVVAFLAVEVSGAGVAGTGVAHLFYAVGLAVGSNVGAASQQE